MSYSISARGATRAEAAKRVAEELDKVVAGQKIHVADRAQAQAAAEAFLDVISADAEDREFFVSVSGSVIWDGTDSGVITAAGVSVSASLVAREE